VDSIPQRFVWENIVFVGFMYICSPPLSRVNVHAPSEDKSNESKDSFYEELEQVFDHVPKYHMKMLLGDFNAKVGERRCSSQQLDRRVSIRIVMIMGLE
jgi:hypothetical protein